MFDFKIVPDDGEPFELTAGMRDIVIWEKTHRGRAFGELGDSGMTAMALYEIAYSACRRQQLVPRGLTEAQFAAGYEIEMREPAPAETGQAPDAPPAVDDDDEPADVDPFDGFAAGSPAGNARKYAAAELRADAEDAHPDDRGAVDPTRPGV